MRPSKYVGKAWHKASKSFQSKLLAAAKDYDGEAARIFTAAAENFLNSVNDFDELLVPIYTGNLIDSIGVRILVGNRIVAYRTMVETTFNQHATKPQHMPGLYPIWGEQEIMERITRPSRRTNRGVVAQLMVGVPYAEEVDYTHYYFDNLSGYFTNKMKDASTALLRYRVTGNKPNYNWL